MLIKIITVKNNQEFIHYCRGHRKDTTIKNLRIEGYKIRNTSTATKEDLKELELITSKPENMRTKVGYWRS